MKPLSHKHSSSKLLLALTALGLSLGSANAAIIFTDSFEDASTADPHPTVSQLYLDKVVGWTNSGNNGVALDTDPAPGSGGFSTPFGAIAAFTYNGTYTRTLTDVLEANTTYTLNVNVGSFRGNFDNDTYAVTLLAAGTVLSTTGITAVTTNDMSEVAEIIFTTGASHTELGNALGIRIGANGSTMGIYDNVSLDASPIPEPSSALLGGLGLLTLLRRRR